MNFGLQSLTLMIVNVAPAYYKMKTVRENGF